MARSHQGTANNNVINLFEKGKDPEEKKERVFKGFAEGRSK